MYIYQTKYVIHTAIYAESHHVHPHMHVDFYLFLRMFNLLYHYFLLALSWRAVLLSKYVTVLIKKVDRFLGFEFLLSS